MSKKRASAFEKAEEEEIGDAPVVDMFGGGDGGGDY